MNLFLKKFTLLGLTATFALAACGDDKGDGPIGEALAPIIQVNPAEVAFSSVSIGEEEVESVIITNIGEGTLELRNIRLVEETQDDAPDSEFRASQEFWATSVDLAKNEEIELAVIYKPLNTTLDSGVIEMDTNDPNHPNGFSIPVTTPSLAPRVFSNPTVKFPRVPPVTEETRNKFFRITTIQNVGQAPLAISAIRTDTVNGDFSISFPESTDNDPELVANDSDTLPSNLELAPDETFPVRVFFNPLTPDPSTAKMIVFSNDPENPEYTIDLVGNSDDPCIEIVTGEDEINFGEGAIGFANNKTITVKNCSPSNDLDITSITVCTDEDGSCDTDSTIYAVKEGTLFGDLETGGTATIGPEDTESFVVTYTPVDTSVSTGTLTIVNNDPSKSTLEVPITGKGTNNRCPEAIAEAKISDSNRYQTEINTIPLKTINFRGTNSVDPDGSIQRYEWALISQPLNSTTRLDDSAAPEPNLFLDLAGEYVIELRVYDDAGTASCGEQAIVTIRATPDEDIHIQLIWKTPADPDQTDVSGSDVDLHFLHPNGTWNRSPWCIFWNNKTNEWGTVGASDDPSLDIDDTNGAGPENINLTDPEPGLTYAVGVHYFTDRGFGPSYATVRIYIQGSQRFELKDEFMATTGDFWYVGTISWPSAQTFAVDQHFDDFPNN